MNDKVWEKYEEVAAYLLNQNAKEFGLEKVQGKQAVAGLRSGTKWVIDAKGIKENNEGFVIVECRRYTTSKQNQEKIGALAYRIIDSGASGGIIVSPLGLQSGAQKVASAEEILEVQLEADCTPKEFTMRFLNKLMVGVHDTIGMSDFCVPSLVRTCHCCGKRFEVQQNETTCRECM